MYLIVDVIVLYVMENNYRLHWRTRVDLLEREPPIQSVYLSEPLWTPHYSLLHRQKDPIRIYTCEQNPMFFHQFTGVPLPKTMDRKLNFCTQLVEDLMLRKLRPELIVQDRFRCSD